MFPRILSRRQVRGGLVLKWAMFAFAIGSIQRTVVCTHSGPTRRMFYPRSTAESETGIHTGLIARNVEARF